MVSNLQRERTRRDDRLTTEVRTAFEEAFGKKNTRVYRYNPASIRVRVIDKRFHGLSLVERERLAWPTIENLSPDSRQDLTVVLLLSPDEAGRSLMSLEFDQPVKSML
jgi:stress-induced morphogen